MTKNAPVKRKENKTFITRRSLRLQTKQNSITSSMKKKKTTMNAHTLNIDHKKHENHEILGKTCSICFKESEWVVTFQLPCQCGFYYHSKCLLEWVEKDITLCWKMNTLHLAAKKNDFKVVQALLVSEIFDVDETNKIGYNALHYAVENGNIDLVKLLIEYGANVEFADDQSSLISIVIDSNVDVEMAKFLIEKGARVDYSLGDYGNFLHLAIEKNSYDMAKLLKENGADVDARNGFGGYSPFYAAAFSGKLKIAKLLYNPESIENVNGEETYEDLLNFLAEKGYVEFLEWLVVEKNKNENV